MPPEQLVPLHTKACRGQGKSSTHHDRPRLTHSRLLNTRVPKENRGNAVHRPGAEAEEGCYGSEKHIPKRLFTGRKLSYNLKSLRDTEPQE